jgi:tetratricopeptide (TPR) repeat protein
LIIGQAMAALAQLDTGLLCVSELKGRTEHTQQEPTPKRAPLEIFDYVLRWNIQEEAESLRVTATLLFVDSEIVSWSHTYTYHEDDFDEMPADMAEQIAQCLWLKLMSTATSAPVAVRRQGNVSREAYLTGRYFWNQRSEQGMRKALRCFESAIDEDPQFALPYSGLADSLTLLSFYEIISPAEAMPGARRAALKAIELDPNLAEAHASLADIHLHFDRDWQAAECEYRRAIQCNPGYAVGYHWYSNLLAARGQHAAAHIAIMQALEIDPVSPITRVWAGVTSHLAHRFDEAIKYYKSALDLDPQFVCAHMYMAQTLEQLGHFEEALREFETTIHLMGGSNCVRAMKAHALAVAGDESAAYRILHELADSPFARCVPSYDIAATYAALGESDQMVLWLDRACKERNMKLFTLIQDPRFDPLRHTLQFKRIVERTGLAQSSATH